MSGCGTHIIKIKYIDMLAIRLHSQNLFLYLYAFSISIESIQPFGLENFSMSKLFAALYFLSILPSVKIFFSLNRNLYFFWPIALFFVWLIYISLVNINTYSSRFFAADIFFNLIIFVAIVNHARKDCLALDKAMFAFAVGAIAVSMMLFLDIGKEINSDGRATFFGAGLNELGIKLAMGLIIISTTLVQDTFILGKKRFFLAVFIPIILLSILETGSRTSFAVLLIAASIWFFLRTMNARNKVVVIMGSVIVLIVVFTPLLFYALQSELFLSRFSSDARVGYMNLGGRDVIWRSFLSLISENIVFGYGLSGYDYHSFQLFQGRQSPHNVIIEILLYIGLVGLAIYLFFLYRVFFASYKVCKHTGNYLPALLLSIFIGFTLSLQGLSEKACWLILAYIVGSYLYEQEKSLLIRAAIDIKTSRDRGSK